MCGMQRALFLRFQHFPKETGTLSLSVWSADSLYTLPRIWNSPPRTPAIFSWPAVFSPPPNPHWPTSVIAFPSIKPISHLLANHTSSDNTVALFVPHDSSSLPCKKLCSVKEKSIHWLLPENVKIIPVSTSIIIIIFQTTQHFSNLCRSIGIQLKNSVIFAMGTRVTTFLPWFMCSGKKSDIS